MVNQQQSVKDVFSDLLMQEKDIVKVYGDFIPEGSSTQLRDTLKKNMDTISGQQFEVFSKMQARGFYPVKNADVSKINETKQQFAGQ